MGKLCSGYCASYRPVHPSAWSTFLGRWSARTANSACPIEIHLAPNLFDLSVFPIWVHDVIGLPNAQVHPCRHLQPSPSPSTLATSIADPHILSQWPNMVMSLPCFYLRVPATSCLVCLITIRRTFHTDGSRWDFATVHLSVWRTG